MSGVAPHFFTGPVVEFKCSQLGRSSLILNDFARSASLMKLEILDRPTKGQNASPDLSRSLRLGEGCGKEKGLKRPWNTWGFESHTHELTTCDGSLFCSTCHSTCVKVNLTCIQSRSLTIQWPMRKMFQNQCEISFLFYLGGWTPCKFTKYFARCRT